MARGSAQGAELLCARGHELGGSALYPLRESTRGMQREREAGEGADEISLAVDLGIDG